MLWITETQLQDNKNNFVAALNKIHFWAILRAREQAENIGALSLLKCSVELMGNVGVVVS